MLKINEIIFDTRFNISKNAFIIYNKQFIRNLFKLNDFTMN